MNVDCIDTFPIIENQSIEIQDKLESLGETYHEHRRQLMLRMQLGLTQTYNAFHAREIQIGITTAALQGLSNKEMEKQWGKEVWKLWNHLQKTEGACSIEEAIAGIVKLRQLHVQMDLAVLAAYGWHTDSNEHINEQGVPCGDMAIDLSHNFYELDYLPENDRIRYTISPEARREVLKRLLALNHRLHAAEVEAGLWDKKPAPSKKKAKANTTEQAGLFDEKGE